MGYMTRRLSQAMHALHAAATNAVWMSTMQVCPPVTGRTRRHRTLGNFAAFNETNAAIARWNDATQRLAAACAPRARAASPFEPAPTRPPFSCELHAGAPALSLPLPPG